MKSACVGVLSIITDNSLRCRPPHTILNHLHLPSLLKNYLPEHNVTLFYCFFLFLSLGHVGKRCHTKIPLLIVAPKV